MSPLSTYFKPVGKNLKSLLLKVPCPHPASGHSSSRAGRSQKQEASLSSEDFSYPPELAAAYRRAVAPMSPDELQCSICPRKPSFSDKSHMLTHVGSKGHLAKKFDLECRARDQLIAQLQLQQYQQWTSRNGIDDAIADRKAAKRAKDEGTAPIKSTKKAGRPAGSGPAAPAQTDPNPDPTVPSHIALDGTVDQNGSTVSLPNNDGNGSINPALLRVNNEAQEPLPAEPLTPNFQPTKPQPIMRPSYMQNTQLARTPYAHAPQHSTLPAPSHGEFSFPYFSRERSAYEQPSQNASQVADFPALNAPSTHSHFSFASALGNAGTMHDHQASAAVGLQNAPNQDSSRLKGIVYPGMTMFDVADSELKRKRNQKKDAAAIERLEQDSEAVTPTEAIYYSPDFDLKKQREITGDVESTPERETPKLTQPPPVPRKRKSGLLGDTVVIAEPKPTLIDKGFQRGERAIFKRSKTDALLPSSDGLELDLMQPDNGCKKSSTHSYDLRSRSQALQPGKPVGDGKNLSVQNAQSIPVNYVLDDIQLTQAPPGYGQPGVKQYDWSLDYNGNPQRFSVPEELMEPIHWPTTVPTHDSTQGTYAWSSTENGVYKPDGAADPGFYSGNSSMPAPTVRDTRNDPSARVLCYDTGYQRNHNTSNNGSQSDHSNPLSTYHHGQQQAYPAPRYPQQVAQRDLSSETWSQAAMRAGQAYGDAYTSINHPVPGYSNNGSYQQVAPQNTTHMFHGGAADNPAGGFPDFTHAGLGVGQNFTQTGTRYVGQHVTQRDYRYVAPQDHMNVSSKLPRQPNPVVEPGLPEDIAPTVAREINDESGLKYQRELARLLAREFGRNYPRHIGAEPHSPSLDMILEETDEDFDDDATEVDPDVDENSIHEALCDLTYHSHDASVEVNPAGTEVHKDLLDPTDVD